MKIKIGLHGATGKMGTSIARLIQKSELYELATLVVSKDDQALDKPLSFLFADLPSSPLCTNDVKQALTKVDVMIDFSSPEATTQLLQEAMNGKTCLVIGTTGLSSFHEETMYKAAQQIPIVYSSNMSEGINTLFALLPQVKQALPQWETEILELHHRNKKDSPSGTAISLAKTLAHQEQMIYGRTADLPRKNASEVAIASIRGGDIVGEHTVFFLSNGERLELTHRATDRTIFAQGALRAARWIYAHGASGLYSIHE